MEQQQQLLREDVDLEVEQGHGSAVAAIVGKTDSLENLGVDAAAYAPPATHESQDTPDVDSSAACLRIASHSPDYVSHEACDSETRTPAAAVAAAAASLAELATPA